MDGIATAIVSFIFVCILFPRLVKNNTQFYAAFAMIIVMLLLHSIAMMFGSVEFLRVTGAIGGLLQLGALIMLVTATGGLSMKELAGEFKDALEVIRRGESEKEIIIPLSGEMARKPGANVRRSMDDDDDDEPVVHRIETPPPAPPPGARKPADTSSIPLE